MVVLWFSNSPASGAEFLKTGDFGGGWLSSLDKLLGQKVELHVAFYYPKYSVPFIYEGIFYHPICKLHWKRNMIMQILFNKQIDKEDLPAYLKIINDVKPDIIHILGTENYFGIVVRKIKTPSVVSIQGNMTVCTQKFFTGIERKYTHLRNISTFISFLTSRSFFAEFRRFKRMSINEQHNLIYVRHIIGRTDWDRRIMSVLTHNAHYYHNDEILRESFYQKQWMPHRNTKVIVHTTNGNSIYKGFETLCQALYILNKKSVFVEWHVAGIKESDLIVRIVKKKLRGTFPELGLVLLGSLSELQLVNKLLEADIYVMTSHIENSPNNLCEAMILGMPCIATYAGGTGSVLKDGEEGILVQDGDPWVLAGAVTELIRFPEKAEHFGIKAREVALKRHNKTKIVNDLLAIYQFIIKTESC